MFDPTIFENLKVVLEGAVYDNDLSGKITVTGRKDQVDLSRMSRYYSIRFARRGNGSAEAEIRLLADTVDLAGEIVGWKGVQPGCRLIVGFSLPVENAELEAPEIINRLRALWGNEYRIRLMVSYEYGSHPQYQCEVEIDFSRKFDEQVIEDIPRMVSVTVESLDSLEKD